jgi:hypothetical protein
MRAAHLRAQAVQQRRVDQDAIALHPLQHRARRHLNLLVNELQRRIRGQPRVQHLVQPQRDVGIGS